MKVRSLSYFISEQTPVYGGAHGTIKVTRTKSIAAGDTSNNLALEFPNHIGTHIDVPKHFNNEGKTVDQYPAAFWVFNKVGLVCCSIDDLAENIKMLPKDLELLILKTGFGAFRTEDRYWAEQPVIPAYIAKLLRETFPNLRVFGFDLISLTSQLDKPEGKAAHLAFLCENDILVVEDMNIQHLDKSPTQVIIAPLLIEGADGVPCTILALYN